MKSLILSILTTTALINQTAFAYNESEWIGQPAQISQGVSCNQWPDLCNKINYATYLLSYQCNYNCTEAFLAEYNTLTAIAAYSSLAQRYPIAYDLVQKADYLTRLICSRSWQTNPTDVYNYALTANGALNTLLALQQSGGYLGVTCRINVQ